MSDRRLLYAAGFLRALATGLVGVLIGIDLARRGFDTAQIGAVVAPLIVTVFGDRFGRRRELVSIALLTHWT